MYDLETLKRLNAEQAERERSLHQQEKALEPVAGEAPTPAPTGLTFQQAIVLLGREEHPILGSYLPDETPTFYQIRGGVLCWSVEDYSNWTPGAFFSDAQQRSRRWGMLPPAPREQFDFPEAMRRMACGRYVSPASHSLGQIIYAWRNGRIEYSQPEGDGRGAWLRSSGITDGDVNGPWIDAL